MDSPSERYLGLTGVICNRQYIANDIGPSIEALKKEFWPTSPVGAVILHRKEILGRKGPFRILNDERTRSRFDERLLGLIESWEYTVLSVVIDKRTHRDRYAVPYHPYHYCLEILLERYVRFLDHQSQCGSVLAEARDPGMDESLKQEYLSILARGTGFRRTNIDASHYRLRLTNTQLRLDRKEANNPGLQLADLLAHEARAEILDHYGHVSLEPHPFQDRVIAAIRAKYYRRARNGAIDGCGRKML